MTAWMKWKRWFSLTVILDWSNPRERRAMAVAAACALAHVALASVTWEASEHGALPVPWMAVLIADFPFSVLLMALLEVLLVLGSWLHSLGIVGPGLHEPLMFWLTVGASGTVWWF